MPRYHHASSRIWSPSQSYQYDRRNVHRSAHRTHAPTFDGNVFKYPAPEFINDFEEYIDRITINSFVSQRDVCYMFSISMCDDALLWMKMFGREYSTYALIRAAFLRAYWGPEVQRRVREDFYYGSYRQTGPISKLAPYFIGMLRRVKNLTSPPSECDFLAIMREHYPPHLQHEIKKLFRAEDVYLMLMERDRIINRCSQLHKIRLQRQKELRNQYDNRCDTDDEDNVDLSPTTPAKTETESQCSRKTMKSTYSDNDLPRSLGGGSCSKPNGKGYNKSNPSTHQLSSPPKNTALTERFELRGEPGDREKCRMRNVTTVYCSIPYG